MHLARPASLALVLAGLTLAVTIRFNTFTPWGTDSAGYIEAGHRWAAGELTKPAPLHFWPPLADADLAVSPLAFRPGAMRGTDVSLYPMGYPLLIAAAVAIGGELAAYLVGPAFAALLVWCTFLLAARAGRESAGLLAAALVALSPVTLVYSVMPMSDVPGTALWVLAWVMSLRPGLGASAAAGAAAAFAMMIRPQLAPLAVVPLFHLLGGVPHRPGQTLSPWSRGALFVLIAAIGPALIAWSQALLYGNPLTPGYIGWDSFFRAANIPINLPMYPKHLVTVHTPLIFLGLAAPLLWLSRSYRQESGADAKPIVIAALVFAAINYGVYLPYMPHDDVFFVRFMLPAIVALFILLANVLVGIARLLRGRWRALAPLALAPAIVAAYPSALVRYGLGLRDDQARVALMGHYLREALPPNAVVFTDLQGGAMAHYTSAPIVRFGLLAPGSLDEMIVGLARRGYRPVIVVDEAMEVPSYKASAAGSRYERFWRPRAESRSTSAMLYFETKDLEVAEKAEKWPTDLVR